MTEITKATTNNAKENYASTQQAALEELGLEIIEDDDSLISMGRPIRHILAVEPE